MCDRKARHSLSNGFFHIQKFKFILVSLTGPCIRTYLIQCFTNDNIVLYVFCTVFWGHVGQNSVTDVNNSTHFNCHLCYVYLHRELVNN